MTWPVLEQDMWNLVSYRWVDRKPCSLTLHLRPISVSLSFPWSHLCVASVSLGLSFVFLILFHYSGFSSVSCSVGPTLCDPMDCSSPDSYIHGILQTRILEWVDMLSPGDLSDPGIQPGSSLQADSLLTEPPGKPMISLCWGNRICYFYVLGIS